MNDPASRFQFVQTQWSLVFEAGKKEGDAAEAARHRLLLRYHEVVYRFLETQLSDPHAAGEVFSKFAQRVLEIHPFLERADPEKGKFRHYLRSILRRMVIDHHRAAQAAGPVLDGSEREQAAADDPPLDEDDGFRKVWTEELLNLAWKELEQRERAGGQPYHTLLLFKAQNPGVRSEEMARRFSGELDRPLTAANVRQILHRGHDLLNDLLVQEVARSLERRLGEEVDADRIEEELLDLELLDKPRKDALVRYRRKEG